MTLERKKKRIVLDLEDLLSEIKDTNNIAKLNHIIRELEELYVYEPIE